MIPVRTYRDCYLYNMKDGSKSADSLKNDRMLIEYINGATRIDKDSEAFTGVIESIKRQQNSSVLLNILLNPQVILCTYKYPLPPSFKVFDAKDIKNNKKHAIFVDVTELLKVAPGYDYYDCKRVDILACYLFSALAFMAYRDYTGDIMVNNNLIIAGAECYANLFVYVIDYLRILGFSASKDKVKYLAALFFLTTVCSMDMSGHAKNIAGKIAKLTPSDIGAYELYLNDTDFSNIFTFVNSIATQFNLKGLTLEVFVRRWIMSFGTGTQYGLELFPAFSTMITSAYTGAYIVNQKQIEQSCAKPMITYTRALLSIASNIYGGVAREAVSLPAKRKDAMKLGIDMKKNKPKYNKKDFMALTGKKRDGFGLGVASSIKEYYSIPGNDISKLSSSARNLVEMDLDTLTECIICDNGCDEKHEDMYKEFKGLFDQTDSVKILDKIRSCAGQIQEHVEKNRESMTPEQMKHCMETVLYINSLAQYI